MVVVRAQAVERVGDDHGHRGRAEDVGIDREHAEGPYPHVVEVLVRQGGQIHRDADAHADHDDRGAEKRKQTLPFGYLHYSVHENISSLGRNSPAPSIGENGRILPLLYHSPRRAGKRERRSFSGGGASVPGGDAERDEAQDQQEIDQEQRRALFEPGEVIDLDHRQRDQQHRRGGEDHVRIAVAEGVEQHQHLLRQPRVHHGQQPHHQDGFRRGRGDEELQQQHDEVDDQRHEDRAAPGDERVDGIDDRRQHGAAVKHVFDRGGQRDEHDRRQRAAEAAQEAFEHETEVPAGDGAGDEAEDQEIRDQDHDRIVAQRARKRGDDDQRQRAEQEQRIARFQPPCPRRPHLLRRRRLRGGLPQRLVMAQRQARAGVLFEPPEIEEQKEQQKTEHHEEDQDAEGDVLHRVRADKL